MTHSVTIVIPVYGDLPSLTKCVRSLANHVSAEHKVFLVNDCGPEADVIEKSITHQIKSLKNFFYFRNDENIGFVKTCNKAVLELDTSENDVLLLNSDTEVTEGFLDEMVSVMYSNDEIGAVSPRTNNATIATIPLSSMSKKGIDPAKSYELFKQQKDRMPRFSIAPVAHGFCMLIRRSVVKKYGLFDEVFGKGYGEEVDFCQRIKKYGYISVLSNHAYVFHLEARSFTHAAKLKMLEQNNKIIISRYPDYKKQVTEYVQKALLREESVVDVSLYRDRFAKLSKGSGISKLLRSSVGDITRILRKLRNK